MYIQIERYTLRKQGFPDIYLRKYIHGSGKYEWETMTSPARGWNDAKWTPLNLEQFPESVILEHIEQYGVKDD